MARRSYGQFCGLAVALDLIGDRWTLLIVRELLIGPARFGEIADALPGIGANLLSERLRDLAEHGIVEAFSVPGDGRGRNYRLTADGELLRDAVLSLARWGLRQASEDDALGATRSSWGFLALESMIAGRVAGNVDEVYQFQLDDEVFHIEIVNGKATAGRGVHPDPAIIATTDPTTFVRIGAALVNPLAVVATGQVRLEGDPLAVERCLHLMGLDRIADVSVPL